MQPIPPPQSLVGKRIIYFAYAIYGQEKHLDIIQDNNTQKNTPCITWLGDGSTRALWIERSFPKTNRIYRTNELGMMLQMTKQSLGIAQLPCARCDPDPDLFRIPAKHIEPGWGLWLLTHTDIRTTVRVRIFKDFLVKELERNIDLIEGYFKN